MFRNVAKSKLPAVGAAKVMAQRLAGTYASGNMLPPNAGTLKAIQGVSTDVIFPPRL